MADAVVVEPVSTAKIPANREKNREFCKIVASGAPETANNGVVTGRPMRIPCSTKQGIVLAEQAILALEKFYRPKLKSSPNKNFSTKGL